MRIIITGEIIIQNVEFISDKIKEKVMKKIVVEMTYDADIIEVPDEVEKKLKQIQNKFDEWIHDKETDHKYWHYKDGKKYCPEFRGDAFVEYLNKVILINSEEKAKVVEMYVENYDPSMKAIWF